MPTLTMHTHTHTHLHTLTQYQYLYPHHTHTHPHTHTHANTHTHTHTHNGCSHADLEHVLVFVTGSPAVGPAGFAALRGYNGAFHKFTIRRAASGDESLPTAQTCFNTLILPPYSSKQVLDARIRLAIGGGAALLDEGAVAT